MTSLPLQVTEDAAQQIREAAQWWHENRRASPELLGDELEQAFRLLTTHPFCGSTVPEAPKPGVRRLLLRKTQYHIYYLVSKSPEAVVVLAFWSTRRGSVPDLG
jgi:plasmid stabilization system protein ParE